MLFLQAGFKADFRVQAYVVKVQASINESYLLLKKTEKNKCGLSLENQKFTLNYTSSRDVIVAPVAQKGQFCYILLYFK